MTGNEHFLNFANRSVCKQIDSLNNILFIIDANNLVGKMGLLDEKDFDQRLIDVIKEYARPENAYILVFDGVDSFGDKYTEGNITIVYAPRDEYCRSADDKIVEILENMGSRSKLGYPRLDLRQKNIIVITDDNLLKKRIEEIIVKTNSSIKTFSAAAFADDIERIIYKKEATRDEIDNKDELSEDDIEEINRDLLRIWRKK